MSLGDFKEFKENMIAHKAKAGGRAGESKLDFEADGKEMEVCDNALGLAVDGHNL